MTLCRSLLFIVLLSTVACTSRRQQRLLIDGDQQLAQGNYVGAAKTFRKVASIDPESLAGVKSFYKLGFVLETYFREYEGAVLSYTEFIRLVKNPIRTYEVEKRLGNIYFEHLRDAERSVGLYTSLLEKHPGSLERDFFYLRLGLSYFQLNNFQESRKQYQRLVEKRPTSSYAAQARFEIGNTYYMQGHYEISVQALKQVLRKHSQSPYAIEAQFLIAQCFEHLENPREAVQIYESLKGRYSSPSLLKLRLRKAKKKLRRRRK